MRAREVFRLNADGFLAIKVPQMKNGTVAEFIAIFEPLQNSEQAAEYVINFIEYDRKTSLKNLANALEAWREVHFDDDHEPDYDDD